MQRHTRFAVVILVFGVVAILGYRLALPWLNSVLQKSTSDSANIKGTLRIGVDGWIGYFPLCSPEMAQRLRREGYLMDCIDDSADYAKRFKDLRAGDLDLAVATVDSYVLNGPAEQFPGAIVAVVDESKGGDAMVAWAPMTSLEEIRKASSFKVAYTPHSPSHHLLKAVASHFDVPQLRDPVHALHSEGSSEAFQWFKAQKAQVAVLWEPELSAALALPGVVNLMSTADTQGLIVDVLLASRDMLRKQPALVELLLKQYFLTLQHYRREPQDFAKDIASHYGVDASRVEQWVGGVEWASLSDNARSWFGLEPPAPGARASQQLVDSLEAAVDVLVDAGDFKSSPLPQNDPFRLINSAPLANVWAAATFNQQDGQGPTQGAFVALNVAEWQRLQPVGTLKIRPIVFASGTSDLTQEGQAQIAKLVKDVKHYPAFRIEVRGHTGLRGDPAQNLKLSQARAEAVYEALVQRYGLNSHRVRAVGFGAERPLPQKAGESDRAYQYRLPRVELVLLEEEL